MAANASIVSFLAADDATVDAMMDRAMPPDNGTASSRQRESNYLLYIGVTVTNFPENQLTTVYASFYLCFCSFQVHES